MAVIMLLFLLHDNYPYFADSLSRFQGGLTALVLENWGQLFQQICPCGTAFGLGSLVWKNSKTWSLRKSQVTDNLYEKMIKNYSLQKPGSKHFIATSHESWMIIES